MTYLSLERGGMEVMMRVCVAGTMGELGRIAAGGQNALWVEDLTWVITRRPSVVFGVQTWRRCVPLLARHGHRHAKKVR